MKKSTIMKKKSEWLKASARDILGLDRIAFCIIVAARASQFTDTTANKNNN